MRNDPETEDVFELGDVSIIEHRWNNPMRVTRWIKAGRGVIELPEREWVDLCTLMAEYLIDQGKVKRRGKFFG